MSTNLSKMRCAALGQNESPSQQPEQQHQQEELNSTFFSGLNLGPSVVKKNGNRPRRPTQTQHAFSFSMFSSRLSLGSVQEKEPPLKIGAVIVFVLLGLMGRLARCPFFFTTDGLQKFLFQTIWVALGLSSEGRGNDSIAIGP